jgi:hypothetical protein
MAAPDTSAYVLATPDTVDLPNSRTLAASGGLQRDDTGPGNSVTITTTGNLANLNAFNTGGFVNYNTSSQQFVPITFTAGPGISITSPDGQGGDTSFSVVANSSVQRVIVQNNGVVITPSGRPALNFIAGPNTSVSIADDPINGTADITLSVATSGAPETSKYIIQTPDAGLPDAQALSPLTTGLMKVTTGTGVISTAVGNTDYQEASPKLTAISGLAAANGSLIVGNGGSYSEVDPGPDGYVYTSTGTSSGWAPAQSGHPFPVVHVAASSTINAVPNTYYGIGSSGITPIDTIVLLPAIPNFGDQFLISSYGPAPASTLIRALSGTALGIGNTYYSFANFTPGQLCFMWLFFVGFISPGTPVYQVLSTSGGVTFTL